MEEDIVNDYDCPLLELTNELHVVESSTVIREVSVVHECTSSCKYIDKSSSINIERESVSCNQLVLEHDYSNHYYCFNIYGIRH